MKIIPYGRQYIGSDDIKLVSKSLKDDLITTGRYVKKFENKISKFLKVKYAVSCNSGTSALHLALMAISLKNDDVVIMPAINFIAVYNMASLMNAKIYLADVDPLTGQMTPKTLLECIKNNKLKKIKVIFTMYLGGFPENVLEFYKLKKKYNFFLIEDACHALGAKYHYNNKILNVGSCFHSDICTFSLHPVKTITSGEGGVVTTNNKFLYKRIRLLRSHGIVRSKSHWNYDIERLGFNYRLSDLNSALALSQIKKINRFILIRKNIFNFYKKNLIDNKKIKLPEFKNINNSSFHLFLVKINFDKLTKKKDFFIKKIFNDKIILQFHYKPIFFFKKIYKKKILKKNYSGSYEYFKSFVSLPIYVGLSRKELIFIVKKIKSFITKYSI
jgi:dTDP-4-amino-4,6-dideoxygalactose transaminase